MAIEALSRLAVGAFLILWSHNSLIVSAANGSSRPANGQKIIYIVNGLMFIRRAMPVSGFHRHDGVSAYVGRMEVCLSDTGPATNNSRSLSLLQRPCVGYAASAFSFLAALLPILHILEGLFGNFDLALFRRHHGLRWRQRLFGLLGLIGCKFEKSHTIFMLTRSAFGHAKPWEGWQHPIHQV